MRYGKFVVYLFTVVFLAVAIYWGIQDAKWDGVIPFSVGISSGAGLEESDCWGNGKGEYYVFLPGYAEFSKMQIHTNTSNDIYIDDQLLSDGMSCEGFQQNVLYDLTYNVGNDVFHFPFMFVQSENVPVMYIDVASGSMDYISSEKGNKETGRFRLYTAAGDLDYCGDLESVQGRGNSTWFYKAKLPYSLTLSTEADLLGMGKAQKWILLSNSSDPSNLRNKISYDFSIESGLAYSPECEWVDLYLNGEYAGLYLLSERNEIHPQRVALDTDNSFLVSMELIQRLKEQGYPYITTENGIALRIHHSAIPSDTMEQIWQSTENAILAEDGIDPLTGKSWMELIDLDSWAEKYVVEEIFGNYDAGSISQYFYYDENDRKIYAGPVWDMDNILGCGEWQALSPYAFLANRPHLWSENDAPLFHALYQKEQFYERVVNLYETVFRPLYADLISEGLNQYAARICQAARMNQIRFSWNEDAAVENTEKIRIYMEKRMAFLDDLWLENEEYCTIQMTDTRYYSIWACYAVRPGECLPDLPELSCLTENAGWFYLDTDEVFDVTQPVYEDTAIYLKTVSSESTDVSLWNVGEKE